jgi:hypothetical protein
VKNEKPGYAGFLPKPTVDALVSQYVKVFVNVFTKKPRRDRYSGVENEVCGQAHADADWLLKAGQPEGLPEQPFVYPTKEKDAHRDDQASGARRELVRRIRFAISQIPQRLLLSQDGGRELYSACYSVATDVCSALSNGEAVDLVSADEAAALDPVKVAKKG